MTRLEIENAVQELYIAILGRAADSAGLKYWSDELESGKLVLENTRAAFTQQVEYLSIYDGLPAEQLVTTVYQNVLGRAPDNEGLTYWISELEREGPVTPDMFVLAVLNAAKEKAGADAETLANKVSVANDFTSQSSSKVVDDSFADAAKLIIKQVSNDINTVVSSRNMIGELLEELTERFLFSYNFEENQLGSYTLEQLTRDVGPNADAINLPGEAEIINVDDNQKLKITLKAGEVKNGIQWYQHFEDHNELYFYYEIEYLDGIQWTKGIKGPGLAGKVGSENPTGGNDIGVDDGFSLRSMTREDGRVVQYIYDQSKSGDFGEDVSLTINEEPFTFQEGLVYQIQQYVKMNTPGQANGELITSINGEQVLHLDDRIWSFSGEYGINSLLVDFWHGGQAGNGFEPTSDSHIVIDNLGVSTLPIFNELF